MLLVLSYQRLLSVLLISRFMITRDRDIYN
nr:MAG TPA: hypothetical protein [Caudoviricetes sp.]